MEDEIALVPDVKICEEGGKGLLLPLVSDEWRWPNSLRGVLYGIAMAWCFLGVSIIADTFMSAIEAVTSRRRKVRLKDGRIITARVWNDTVANLSLMALGSSAPEILLSVIELLKRDMYSGELGPSTIVGSAAFNLFVIVALCIFIIPSTEHRKVKELSVLYITAVFSLFAYVWLVVILRLVTPDVVDFWEAFITFLCFPLLVGLSWMADTGKIGCGTTRRRQHILVGTENDPSEELLRCVLERVGSKDEQTVEAVRKCITEANLSSEASTMDIEALINSLSLKPGLRSQESSIQRKSRAAHRMEATRAFTGAKKGEKRRGSFSQTVIESPIVGVSGNGESNGNEVTFTCDRQWLSGNLSQKPIALARIGNIGFDVNVYYSVHVYSADKIQASASMSAIVEAPSNGSTAGQGRERSSTEDTMFGLGREAFNSSFVFPAGETRAQILVERPNCIVPGQFDDFLVRLTNVEVVGTGQAIGLGAIPSTQVIISPVGAAGYISFAKEFLQIQATSETQKTQALVVRKAGCCGAVSVNYHTEKLTALPGCDYAEASGVLDFADGVTEQMIELEILPKGLNQCSDEFLVLLEDPVGGATFDPQDDGGEECSILTVSIRALEPSTSSRSLDFFRWMDRRLLSIGEVRVGRAEWKDQFAGAVYCNGSKEDQAEASKLDWTFHLLSLPWKLLFTLVPPTTFFNGWLRFYTSLAMIGVVTGIIGDLAELFGCVIDLPDAVTAITFVALGTSMPDLFASQSAAMQDSWADASICNVTGSNSVNVFLGLGLPWTLGAIHWNVTKRTVQWESRYPEIAKITPVGDSVFVVEAKSLAFSVLVYAGASLTALGILQLRRKRLGFELGGPWKQKASSAVAFVTLWFAYLVLAIWQVLRDKDASDTEATVVIISVVGIESIFVLVCIVLLLRYKAPPEDAADTCQAPADENSNAQVEEGATMENGASRKAPFVQSLVVPPPDFAAGMPVLKGSPNLQSPLPMTVEVSREFRSPPLATISEFDVEFGDRPVAQPHCTPVVNVDLMNDSPMSAIQAAQDYRDSMDGRLAPKVILPPPVVHVPNVTRDAALLDPREGGARRMFPPYMLDNSPGTTSTTYGSPSGQEILLQL